MNSQNAMSFLVYKKTEKLKKCVDPEHARLKHDFSVTTCHHYQM